MSHLNEQEIINSWEVNAGAWAEAVQQEKIESRKLATDQAIIDAVMRYHPSRALDAGCGEGWLARRLAENSVMVTGVDVVPALIENARQLGGGEFEVCSYEDIAGGRLQPRGQYDAVICNFSLLGYESVHDLIRHVPKLLSENGRLFVQTLQPVVACGDRPYREGWRPGSWEGFGPEFQQPAPWYFRTLAGWINLFAKSGLQLTECIEPVHPVTGKPVSIIFVCLAPWDF